MFRTSLLALALTAVAPCVLTQAAQAQVTRIPNSGCPGALYPITNDQTGIGQTLQLRCPPCSSTEQGMVIIGVTARPPRVMNPPLVCPPQGNCVLVCEPIQILFPVSGWRIDIPRDPNLIGVCVCVQCGCVDLTRACLTLSGALRICVTRR